MTMSSTCYEGKDKDGTNITGARITSGHISFHAHGGDKLTPPQVEELLKLQPNETWAGEVNDGWNIFLEGGKYQLDAVLDEQCLLTFTQTERYRPFRISKDVISTLPTKVSNCSIYQEDLAKIYASFWRWGGTFWQYDAKVNETLADWETEKAKHVHEFRSISSVHADGSYRPDNLEWATTGTE